MDEATQAALNCAAAVMALHDGFEAGRTSIITIVIIIVVTIVIIIVITIGITIVITIVIRSG